MAIREILDALDKNENWLVLTHEKPDGDTIGCASAIAHLGLRRSKNVVLGGPDPAPERYAFLRANAGFRVLREIPRDFRGVIVCVDTSTALRSVPGLSEAAAFCTVVNIDHHVDNGRYGTLNWIDASASATGEMVTTLLAASQWGIDPVEAEALYTALVSDNGQFSFASTTEKSHECAIALIRAGASPTDIATHLGSSLSDNVIHLWGRAMQRADTFAGGRCAIYWLSEEDFRETQTSRQDTENLVNVLLMIKGVSLAALCSETADGVRVSLRARAPYNARIVAASFGGGGHDLAAGCTVNAPLRQAISQIREEMEHNAATGPPASR